MKFPMRILHSRVFADTSPGFQQTIFRHCFSSFSDQRINRMENQGTELKPLCDEEAYKICAHPPHESTKDFLFQQTMYRIKDPRRSLIFYSQVLGMTLLQKIDMPSMKFTVYFLGYESRAERPHGDKERTQWALTRKATLELTHNWGTENQADFSYKIGNADGIGYGHIGILVPDLDAACARFEEHGVQFVKKPNEGQMKGLAFIKDPDGYWIELFSKNVTDAL